MNAQFTAILIDHSLSILGGIIATLIGFRFLGLKPGSNANFDSIYSKWVKHLKWVGPLLILISCVQLAIKISSNSEPVVVNNHILRYAILESVSSEGNLSEQDHTISVSDGFRLLVPKDYTYSKPPGSPFSLVAIHDSNGTATPVISVYVSKLTDRIEPVIESMKEILISKNKTTKFSDTQIVDKGRFKLYRTTMSSQRDGDAVKGGMLFFENDGKSFMLTYGTREELFDENASTFEKIINSFGPT